MVATYNLFKQSSGSLETNEELLNSIEWQTEFDIDQQLIKVKKENRNLRNENSDLLKTVR